MLFQGLTRDLAFLDKLQNLVSEDKQVPKLHHTAYAEFCQQMIDNVKPRRSSSDKQLQSLKEIGIALDHDGTLRKLKLANTLEGMDKVSQKGHSAYKERQLTQEFAQMYACRQALIKIFQDQAELLRVFERKRVAISPEARQKVDLANRTLPYVRVPRRVKP